jgi:hypothetical protein
MLIDNVSEWSNMCSRTHIAPFWHMAKSNDLLPTDSTFLASRQLTKSNGL